MKTMRHEFVENIPEKLENGIVYISITYSTVAHLCACGCKNEVFTPLSPTDWKLTFDGESVSLYPSIGNWGFACKSHYWIKNNVVEWSKSWTKKQVDAGRFQDRVDKVEYYSSKSKESKIELKEAEAKNESAPSKISFWSKLKKLFNNA